MITAAESTLNQRLSAQETALTALRADHAALLARLATGERRRPARRRPYLLAALALTLLVAIIPLALSAATPFTDIAGSPHNADIDLIYNVGITTGCGPTEYCPNANVTRQEMASFLARTAGLGANPPVVNARTLRGYAPNDLLRVAQARGTNLIGDDFAITSATPTYQELPGAVVTIDAPGNGFILVSSSVSVSGFTGIVALARLRDITPGAPPTAVSPEISRFDAGDFGTTALSQTFLFPVTGAGMKTFRIELAKSGATNPAARSGVITALFVPFNGVGTTP